MNDYALGEVIYWPFTTRAFATGVPTALAGSPTLEIYENDSVTPIVEGASKLVLTQNLNSINGFNLATITATTGNGFEVGKDYTLIIKTGTVGGTSVVGEVIGRFSIGRLNVTKWAATAVNALGGAGGIPTDSTGKTSFNDLSAAAVNAEVVDALATDTYAEPGQGAPAATTSLSAKINYLYKWIRNKMDNNGTTTNMYADDGTTVDQKRTTSESGGTTTKSEIASGP